MNHASAIHARHQKDGTSHIARRPDNAVAETQLWEDEHDWLVSVMRSEDNVSPAFRIPDLIGACVALVMARPRGSAEIFGYVSEQLVLRDPRTPRRMAHMWREHFEWLRSLQRSPANRHPNPRFQLDQLTTACVALIRATPHAAKLIYEQARHNMCVRMAAQRGASPPS